jgi:hypothetical protein
LTFRIHLFEGNIVLPAVNCQWIRAERDVLDLVFMPLQWHFVGQPEPIAAKRDGRLVSRFDARMLALACPMIMSRNRLGTDIDIWRILALRGFASRLPSIRALR